MDTVAIQARLAERFGEAITAGDEGALQPWLVVTATQIAEVALFCRDEADLGFDNLMCLSAVDWPKADPPRLEMVYHLFSYRHRHTFVLKAHLPRDGASLPSVEAVWPVANWHEREAFDLFGIHFTGHSDLRRILLPDDWQGHPLRKDWEDPEFYNGMRVKPTEQMADRALAGEQIGVGPFAQTPHNAHETS